MPTSQAQSVWPLQKPQQLVYIELGPDNGAMMLGICEQGFSFRAISPLKSEDPVHFTFALDGNTRLQGTGEVAWSEEGGKTGGLKFTAVSPQFRESLHEWLASESTLKAVGREVTPAVALSLDSLTMPNAETRPTFVEEAKPTAPPHLPETKLTPPPKPVAPAPVATKPIVPVPAALTPPQEQLAEPAQTKQLIPQVELRFPTRLPPQPQEQKTPETKPTENVQPEQFAREVETPVPDAPPSQQLEAKPAETKPKLPKTEPQKIDLPRIDPPKPAELPHVEPIVPEPELRTVAPLPPADETPSEPLFSLPNFRLPSEPVVDLPAVPHLPMKEIAQAAAKTAHIEASPALSPPPKTSSLRPDPSFREDVLGETEASDLPREHEPHELFSEDFVAESPRLNRAAAAGIIGLALGVILTALVFSFRREAGEILIRLGRALASEEQKSTAAQQPASSAASAQNPQLNSQQGAAQPPKTADSSSVQPTDKSSSALQPSTTIPTQTLAAKEGATNVLPSGSATANNVQRIQDLPPAPDGGSGEKEFQQARNILKGNHRQRDLSLAVRLLWTGVRKGNVPAEVTLADLYARGDGVARSCEQARVLLESAIQKGSPEARRRLGILKQQGCS